MERDPVDLVRVPREEKYYDREEVLGRDATSVFPTESRRVATAESAALAELLGGGNKRFISETELETIQVNRGLADAASLEASKPLVEVLREAKEAKESAFQDQWKQMKQGKNRPLDEDELTFLDEVAEAEAARQRAAAQEEENELAAFHAAQQQRGAGGDAAAAAAAAENDGEDYWQGAGAGPQVQQAAAEVPAAAARAAKPAPAVAKKAPLVAIKPLIRPIVRVKGRGEQPPAPAAAAASSEPAAKRARTAAGGEQQAAEGSGSDGEPGLGGLLGGYGSGSDSD